VRHPASPRSLVSVGTASEVAVATSAAYFANSTLVDPRTRQVVLTDWSATVIAGDCVTADALTKPCLLERSQASALAARFGAQVVLLSPQHPLQ
jgi:thiamine biosynthesis lipoprotein